MKYDFMWWVSAAAYFVVAGLLLRNSPKESSWGRLALFMALLGANKLLDLTGIVVRSLRKIAWNDGWYGERSPIQKWFIVGVAVLLVISAIIVMIRPGRRQWTGGARIALVGLLYLLAYSFIRSTSLHFIDGFLYRWRFGVQLNWFFELGGVGLVTAMALVGRRKKKIISQPR